MSKPNKKRIETSPAQGGLNNAFAQALGGFEAPPAAAASNDEPAPPSPPDRKKERLILRKETAHRGGKAVIVVSGFAPGTPEAVLEKLARMLRKTCGSGGTVRDGEIEIQGEHVARIRQSLEAEGYRVGGIS